MMAPALDAVVAMHNVESFADWVAVEEADTRAWRFLDDSLWHCGNSIGTGIGP
jgi:hypothetical protein